MYVECVKCLCVWLGVGWELKGVKGLGLDFNNHVESGGVCLCLGCGDVIGVGKSGWVA